MNPDVADKQYSYKVYDQTGAFIKEWTDVKDQLQFSQQINTPGTSTTVQLARSARSTIEKRDVLTTQSGETLTTQSGEDLISLFVSNNSIGEGTDVDLNYFVDISVAYGGFESLTTQSGEDLTDQTGDILLFPIGAPLGTKVFSGYIANYSLKYSAGMEDGVEVLLLSNGAELSQDIIKSGSATTVTYSSTDHGQVIRNILDQNTGKMKYAGTSVVNTGVNISPTYKLNTYLEGIEDAYDQSPPGYYWYGNVADNTVYFQMRSATPNHTFILGNHIKELNLKKSIEGLVNQLFFVGGEVSGTALYKKYSATSSITRKGIERKTDRRYTLTDSMQKYANKRFAKFKDPAYTTSIEILSVVYQIEDIQLGQVVAFKNFGNFVDDVQLQIVGRQYKPTSVILELGEVLDRQVDTLADVEKDLQTEQQDKIPSTPS